MSKEEKERIIQNEAEWRSHIFDELKEMKQDVKVLNKFKDRISAMVVILIAGAEGLKHFLLGK